MSHTHGGASFKNGKNVPCIFVYFVNFSLFLHLVLSLFEKLTPLPSRLIIHLVY